MSHEKVDFSLVSHKPSCQPFTTNSVGSSIGSFGALGELADNTAALV
ncbi:MAG: hypothetical protein N0E48_04875 [Candidatus Thiodiazotropha endolucinida]|nr:hypothetical protein [Candidatus Thiodiazotropha endolucinida]